MTDTSSKLTHLDLFCLYTKYEDELRKLAYSLRKQFYLMQQRGYMTGFGDVEGEIVYLIIRETQPEIAVEISPNAGWSTNYILAALTANKKGTLHSFEISSFIRGKRTEDVVRDNQYDQWDQEKLTVHIGDARHTISQVTGTVNFLLLDSCHEDWFAKWYTDILFPRVEGPIVIQDIAFTDQFEPSSEARYVLDWVRSHRIQLTLMGQVEKTLEEKGLRTGYAERRGLRSNSILFRLPSTPSEDFPELNGSPELIFEKVHSAVSARDNQGADRLLTQIIVDLLRTPTRVNRHRLFFKAGQYYVQLGEQDESQRCFQRALGVSLQSDIQQRVKSLTELLALFLNMHQWRLLAQTALLLVLEPRAWPKMFEKVKNALRIWMF